MTVRYVSPDTLDFPVIYLEEQIRPWHVDRIGCHVRSQPCYIDRLVGGYSALQMSQVISAELSGWFLWRFYISQTSISRHNTFSRHCCWANQSLTRFLIMIEDGNMGNVTGEYRKIQFLRVGATNLWRSRETLSLCFPIDMAGDLYRKGSYVRG